jgi:hypothetical protein
MSAVTAAALLVAGMALLDLAWRESQKEEGGPPAWLPMPAVVVSLTMTLIFWIGLQEREMAYLDASTMNASDQIATNVKSDVDQQMNALDRLARNEADNPDTTWPRGTIDAASFFDESKELGCVSISLIDAAGQKLTSRWVYPDQGSAASAGFDHSMDPRRREAIEAARTANAPEVTTTPDSDGKGNPGFVIYAPIGRSGSPSHYASAEYLYARFFSWVFTKQLKLSGGYTLTVKVGPSVVYTSTLSGSAGKVAPLERRYPNLFGQRVLMILTPTGDLLRTNKRYLPEMALAGGLAITLLLGFTLHLARRARSGQYLSDLSNKRLVAENEERRRIEARLKVSDERLRLASTPPRSGSSSGTCRRGTSTTARASGACSATSTPGCRRRSRSGSRSSTRTTCRSTASAPSRS